MSLMINSLLLAAGLTILSLGGHFLVRSTIQLSRLWGVKPLFLSIVILGMGTSAPEWFVTSVASFQKSSGMALGNVIGSNIANILLILGLSGLFHRHLSNRQVTWFDLPAFLLVTLLLWICSVNGIFSRLEGGFFLILFIVYLALLFKQRKPETTLTTQNLKSFSPSQKGKKTYLFYLGSLLLGFIGLFAGSILTVESAAELGKIFGFSEKFIGLFVLSVGTSLPELAVSLQAIFKKQEEMALGNVVGSNMFNSIFVLGSAGLIEPVIISPGFLRVDYPFLFAVSLLLFGSLVLFKALPRILAGGFLVLYFSYIFISTRLFF